MRRTGLLATLLLVAAGPLAARETIGVWRSWGAFRDRDRCYAIASPASAGGASRWRPFASVARWTETSSGRGLRASLHVRLSRERDRSAPVTLTVGERRFALVGNGVDAFATDAASDRAIVAALRGARSMSIETVGVRGRPFADSYALRGAATAIDAAILACAGR
ncbi:hypothetical protein [Sphingomonas abaci]|nr:hypothetical protein [Sphingomonas abaci]